MTANSNVLLSHPTTPSVCLHGLCCFITMPCPPLLLTNNSRGMAQNSEPCMLSQYKWAFLTSKAISPSPCTCNYVCEQFDDPLSFLGWSFPILSKWVSPSQYPKMLHKCHNVSFTLLVFVTESLSSLCALHHSILLIIYVNMHAGS